MRTLALLLFLAVPLQAQNWSASIGSGPFVFGHFAERKVTIGNEGGGSTTTSRLSAATRIGLSGDIERNFGRWLAVRLEVAGTRAPLSIKSSSSSSAITLDAGHISVTTLSLPLVVHLNGGAFRFHALAGPAYGMYDMNRQNSSTAGVPLFEGTRGRWGAALGFGAAWWWSPRFGVEWQVEDIATESPLHVSDVAASSKGVKIMKTHNGHTSLGIRYRF